MELDYPLWMTLRAAVVVGWCQGAAGGDGLVREVEVLADCTSGKAVSALGASSAETCAMAIPGGDPLHVTPR